MLLLFLCENHCERVVQFELTRLKKTKEKKKKEKHFGCLVTLWFGTFTFFFGTTRRVLGHEALESEW